MSISVNTKRMYEDALRQLDKQDIDYKNIPDVNDFLSKISINTSYSKLRMYIASVLWFRKEYDLNKLNEKEQESFLTWDEIFAVYTKLYNDRLNSKMRFSKCVAIALYTLFPPRRLLDYTRMIVKNTDKDIDEKHNFYIINPIPRFIFNVYKTANIYGKQIFTISKELYELLNSYVIEYDLIDCRLMPLSEAQLSTKIKKIFIEHASKPATVNTMRHSFISHMAKKGNLLHTTQQIELSQKMAHSYHTQQDIYRKVD